MNNRPIGVFDSGLGGLTAVKELLKVLPNEDIIYFGDTGRVPYGNKSQQTILKYARQDTQFLKSLDVKLILSACGTVSSVVEQYGLSLNIPLVGVVRPTAASAAGITQNGKIGIIGTAATIKSGSYRHELLKINSDLQIFEQSCPLFVPLVENGFIHSSDKVTLIIAKKYLSWLKEKQIDTLILGCTHYPIIKDIISEVVGHDVNLIDSGRESARFAADLLKSTQSLSESNTVGSQIYYVSDAVDEFSELASLFLEQDVKQNVKMINIEDYSKLK